jgi:predicted Rossmann fold nucleotide-binding protein DprA/Smf involved in DNA uptake
MLANLTEHQSRLVSAMNDHPADVDALVERSGLAAPVVLQQLTLLSLRGIVRRVDGNSYVRSK